MTRFEAVIFDLDGVLADSASAHFAAWRRLGRDLGIEVPDEIHHRLKGVDRLTSLDIILAEAGLDLPVEERRRLAEIKNGYYRESIAAATPDDLLPGAKQALEETRAAGFKTALASSSRNAPDLIVRLQIADKFDYVADAAKLARAKPDPQIFLTAAAGLSTAPAACIGVEDAAAGIEAIKRAGMYAVGVGSADDLGRADELIGSIEDFDIQKFS